ncbi:MAG: MFS transporter [Gammaproteobacteria bacterium]|nr:MFS transporter [Gammaproteobacteria bacterium]
MSADQPLQNNSNHPNNRRCMAWIIWGLAAAFFFSEYFARVSPSVMTEGLMHDFGVTAFALGALASFFYYAYVGMQLPVGMLMDRYGCRRLLTATALLCGLSCFLFGSAKNLYIAELARFIMGFSAAFAFVGALKLASEWFPAARFGLLAGMTQGLGMLGASVGEGPVAVLVDHAGWRYSMLIMGTILLIIGVLMWFIIKDHPFGGVNRPILATTKKPYSLLRSLIIVMRNPQTWLNGIAVGFLYAPTETFAELWGPSYLHHVNNINREVASSAVGMIFIGWFISSPIMGWVSDKIERRKPILIFSTLSSMIVMSAVLYLPHLPVFVLGIVKSEVRQSHSIFLRMFFENIQPVTRHYGAPWGAY